ncbi:MerR family transcriptional regulator [Subtercola vilae]|uniref:MerR family transcriptional regulator n=1 Tax=Subtercola vilae TaxID=2056433 RepID=A0A4T2BI32_9MICO|nr:MerR family transcriptional regulator [Subtercola vilae]TIH29491.1 MerR family transcriptional regulator [Subtercola vilae]
MMHIGELAELTRLSLRTIRHYDETGLLHPSGRTEGGFRLYTVADHGRLLLIRQMRALSFTLDDIASFLRGLDSATCTPDTDDADRLLSFMNEAVSRRESLAEQLAMADEFINQLRTR